jgi:hypothetical protein
MYYVITYWITSVTEFKLQIANKTSFSIIIIIIIIIYCIWAFTRWQ